MKRTSFIFSLLCALVFVPAAAARANHMPTDLGPHTGSTANKPILQTGPISLVANLPVARGVAAPLGDRNTPAFTRDGRSYLVASSTIYGLHVVDVTDPLAPVSVSDYASAFGCPTAEAEYGASRTGDAASGDPRQLFDIGYQGALAAPGGWENDVSVTPDGMIAAIGADAPGRCHDPVYGGVELVDLSDLLHPRTLALTRNVGFSHSVGIDPKRPWLAYVSTTDGDDFVDIVDFRSCLGGVARIDACKPVVARADFTPSNMDGIPADPKDPAKDLVPTGCHDTRFHGDRVYCAAVDSTLILDISKVVGADGQLTGTHLDCPLADAQRAPGVKVTDCSSWSQSKFDSSHARAVDMRAVSVIVHDGNKPPTQDISIAHQAEAIEDGKIMIITDERGGGLGFGPDQACPGGGIWFYDIRDEAHPKLMRMMDGSPAIYFSKNFVQTYASCTVHYGTQVPGERLLTFAWYTAGTHIVRYNVDYSVTPARIGFSEVASYVPSGGWTIQNMPMGRDKHDPNKLIVYAADVFRGLDVFTVNIPRLGGRTAGGRGTNTGGGGGTTVLGDQVSGGGALPRTGVGDPGILTLFVVLLAIAVPVMRRYAR
jgi:hypothetical protein